MIYRVAFAVTALAAMLLMPDPPATAQTNEAAEATHDQLRALRMAVEAGFNAGDVNAIMPYLHESVVFTTMNGDTVKGPQGVRDYFGLMMEGPDKVVEDISISFEADDLTTLFHGNTGVAVGNSAAHYKLASGLEFDVEARWTATMVRQDEDWLIAAFHYSTNMFDNPVLNALKEQALWYGVGGALAMLLIGLVVGLRIRRRKA